jgi:hypothetical protein
LDVDNISIVHDAPRLPSTTLINMNRRAMGMEELHGPRFLKKERKEEKTPCRWEEGRGLLVRTRSCKKLKVQKQQDLVSTTKPARRPGLGSRQCSDSMLLRPRRQPWTSSPKPCNNKEGALSQTKNGAVGSSKMSTTRVDRRAALTRHTYIRDSILAMPTRGRLTVSPMIEETSPEEEVDEELEEERHPHFLIQRSVLLKET